MATELETFLESRTAAVEILALGEPAHGEPAFPRLRNQFLAALAHRGFRSIAVESDRIAALTVDDYVRGGAGTLDGALAEGFSHGLGELPANRELLDWMRAHNESVPEEQRLAFHGFDAPLEMTAAASPGTYLRHLVDYLAAGRFTPVGPSSGSLRAELDRLIDDDARWSDPAAQMDAAKSVGRAEAARDLRVLADDLLTVLHAEAPRLVAATTPAAWRRARSHATAALDLLRYHAVAADPAPPAERTSRMLGVRDAVMAQNLLDIRAHEHRRGPTLVFAHNRHLQRHPSRWLLADMDLEWSSAGAIVSALLGDRYTVVIGSVGASVGLGLQAPPADTFEGELSAATGQGPLFPADRLPSRARVRTDGQGYFPLDAETVAHCDAVWHFDRFPPAAAALADRIVRLPGVEQVQAGPETGAPELGWDDRFFYAGADRRRPFATIVAHDIPGFDEQSRLDRAGVYRLNIELGRDEFRRVFGYGPEGVAAHRAGIDFAALDQTVPHPIYAVQGWASVLNPAARSEAEVERLLAYARHRAAEREHRRT